MEEQLEPGFAREQLAIYDHAIATGRPFPASFFAHLGSNPRKRSLQSFHYDGSTCTEAMKQDYVRRLREHRDAEWPMVDEPAMMGGRLDLGFAREQLAICGHAIATGRPLPASFFAHLGSNARKRSLRSFRYDGSTCTEAMKQDYVQKLLLSNQKYFAERGLASLNQWAPGARRNIDVAKCAEAAALTGGRGGQTMEATATSAAIGAILAQVEARDQPRQRRTFLQYTPPEVLQRRRSILDSMASELAMYEAAIAAGTPLPDSIPLPAYHPEQHQLLANGGEHRQRSTMDYVEFLGGAVRRGNESLARLREQSNRSLQGLLLMARKELDVADCANAAARSRTLPRAMGESTVTEEPVTGLA
ncbi:hypothetical protein V501_07435 [Pseudogymnoascus sp. VKM F-4519 (FW-2642)]|nr:hypothetical protein V501_07435 [Pseudogymnoascus sp. VKM F-4519 (FW-2642)]